MNNYECRIKSLNYNKPLPERTAFSISRLRFLKRCLIIEDIKKNIERLISSRNPWRQMDPTSWKTLAKHTLQKTMQLKIQYILILKYRLVFNLTNRDMLVSWTFNRAITFFLGGGGLILYEKAWIFWFRQLWIREYDNNKVSIYMGPNWQLITLLIIMLCLFFFFVSDLKIV